MSAQCSSVLTSMPWLDATGRLSPLKSLTLVAICLPVLWMAMEVSSGNWDFPSPFVLLIYNSGLWTTYLLLLSLLITPLRQLTGWGKLIQIRRMLGVACFYYGALHVVAWFGLRFWNWAELAWEGVSRPSLWAATLSFVVIIALAATSFDRMIGAMGAQRWRRLHRLVYAATFLAVLHFLMSPGSLQGLPFLMAGAYFWLMAWRLLGRHTRTSIPAMALLGLGSSLFVFFLQPIWLAAYHPPGTVQTPWDAMAGNFDLEVWRYLGVPPVWVMLAWTIFTVLIATWRQPTSLKAISPRSVT